jgi:hypothetical protein
MPMESPQDLHMVFIGLPWAGIGLADVRCGAARTRQPNPSAHRRTLRERCRT